MSSSRSTNVTRTNGLLAAAAQMRESLQVLREINAKANIIALNAAIEGARTRGRLDSFSIVAEQIAGQASRNGELSEQLDQHVGKLQYVALQSTAARYYELAEDLIDKLDRNLFERNCDVQAWTTFDAIVDCAISGKSQDKTESTKAQSTEVVSTACRLLERLMATYVVYEDIYLCNKAGVVIATGRRKNLIGASFADRSWFTTAVNGKVDVADMNFDESIGKHAVFYSAPVLDREGTTIGVLTTRFNWDFAQEMIDSGGYEDDVQAYLINREGVVIGSTDRIGVTRDSLDWLDGGRLAMKGSCGYSIETARNGAPLAVGFSRTKGYNSYRGKEWSAVVAARLGNVKHEQLCHVAADRTGAPVPSHQGNFDSKNEIIESELANRELQVTMKEINELVSLINTTNNETNMLAINAAIQAGIAGTEGESFAVIAAEIGRLAEKSVAFVQSVNKTASQLQKAVEQTVAARLSDAARDTIDKVDRNLFERFCDVQAWTTFGVIVDAVKNGDPQGAASEFLAKIHKIYEVYHDIYLLDNSGKIVASAVRRDLRGHNQANRPWFQESHQGKVHVSEVYQSTSANGLTMAFSAPVLGPDGTVVGVLTTRFNWEFIYGILDTVIADSQSKVYLLNSAGIVIGSTDRLGILERSFSNLKALRELGMTRAGHTEERDTDENIDYSIGFSRTTGYNTYAGKNWSVIIRRPKVTELVDESTNATPGTATETKLKAA